MDTLKIGDIVVKNNGDEWSIGERRAEVIEYLGDGRFIAKKIGTDGEDFWTERTGSFHAYEVRVVGPLYKILKVDDRVVQGPDIGVHSATDQGDGTEGTVTEVNRPSDLSVTVEWDNGDDNSYFAGADRFEVACHDLALATRPTTGWNHDEDGELGLDWDADEGFSDVEEAGEAFSDRLLEKDIETEVEDQEILSTASGVGAILEQRQKTHGDFADHARITQSMKDIAMSGPSWDDMTAMQKESVSMILHKIGRAVSGNPHFQDHWDDIAGYSTLVSERL